LNSVSNENCLVGRKGRGEDSNLSTQLSSTAGLWRFGAQRNNQIETKSVLLQAVNSKLTRHKQNRIGKVALLNQRISHKSPFQQAWKISFDVERFTSHSTTM